MAKAKATTKLENFLSDIRSQHTPRADRFEVFFTPPDFIATQSDIRSIAVYCEEAQIPGLAATNLPIKIGAWTEYRTQNVEFLTTDMSFTFICDQEWAGRKLFENWINASADPLSKEVAYYKDVIGTVNIRSLSVNDDILAEWTLHDVVPKLINLTPVSWSNTGFIRMTVSVSAKRWTREYANVGAAAQDTRNMLGRIFGRLIERFT
tara:strand:+ start:1060 stop:1680 length:621 start_codon:yes stop_codon:yes gene_type:complete